MRPPAGALAATIMDDFATRTGLTGDGPQRRYLWTDAFATCNYLTLYRRSGEERNLRLAVELVRRVHLELGRHRADDRRTGWISGLDEEEGREHPTAGGLRIGKLLPERGVGEPFDRELEWDRDGQYFHYLTRWMCALDRVGARTGAPRYRRWAEELATAALSGFSRPSRGGGTRRLCWKMSIDLTRPLVDSEGTHDPLDGFVSVAVLRGASGAGDVLRSEIEELANLCRGRDWTTDDALGIGGLLTDAWRMAHLVSRGGPDRRLIESVLPGVIEASVASLARLVEAPPFLGPPEHRLAFRELGLVVGLAAVERLRALPDPTGWIGPGAEELIRYRTLAGPAMETWARPASRATRAWSAHRDINEVMLATALAPDEYLAV